mgnify:CR=1 FL=1
MGASLSWFQAFASSEESTTMPSADFCPITPSITEWGAPTYGERKAGQISPDKNVNFCHTTAAFTISSEVGALSCCANSPPDLALYAVSVRRLVVLRSGFLQAKPHGFTIAFG